MIFTEQELASMVIDAVKHRFLNKLETGYLSPLDKIIEETIQNNRESILAMLNGLLVNSLKSVEFKKTLQEEFNRKIAKTLISKVSGSVEKSVNQVMMNAETKAKLILAITNIVNE